jgi:hypothetical protein
MLIGFNRKAEKTDVRSLSIYKFGTWVIVLQIQYKKITDFPIVKKM